MSSPLQILEGQFDRSVPSFGVLGREDYSAMVRQKEARRQQRGSRQSRSCRRIRNLFDDTQTLEVKYPPTNAEVAVDSIVKLKGPQETSTGWQVLVWAREGRETKLHGKAYLVLTDICAANLLLWRSD